MSESLEIDYKLLAIAKVKLEHEPESLSAFVRLMESSSERGERLRSTYTEIKARCAGNFDFDGSQLTKESIAFVDAWKQIYQHLENMIEIEATPNISSTTVLKNPVDNLSIYTLEHLTEFSGRTTTEIFDDIQRGTLNASVLVRAIDADDHIKREMLSRTDEDTLPFLIAHARVVWITAIEAGVLFNDGEVSLSRAEYPIYVDGIRSPAVKRYKKEIVNFPAPFIATICDLRFLDGDAIQYIAKHTGKRLVETTAVRALTKPKGGGHYIVYRLWEEVPEKSCEEISGVLTETPSSVCGAEPVQRSQAMQAAILNAISELGIDPKAIPRNPSGLPGVKSRVSQYLGTIRTDVTSSKFRKAWQALRDSGEIQDA
ncbi:hypothetical protein [Haliea sp. E17]|uniref:hypothetical protein n=1 Tax=Haliea sp. E17 TaxID=3401576 RepID=UPI003AADA832